MGLKILDILKSTWHLLTSKFISPVPYFIAESRRNIYSALARKARAFRNKKKKNIVCMISSPLFFFNPFEKFKFLILHKMTMRICDVYRDYYPLSPFLFPMFIFSIHMEEKLIIGIFIQCESLKKDGIFKIINI